MNDYAHLLALSDHLRESLIKKAIPLLTLPKSSHGLDAGCGIGNHTIWLAQAVGPDGHVTGLDLSTELLALAGRAIKDASLEEQVFLVQGDITRLPFDDNTFDWVWSVDCAAYIGNEPASTIRELTRVVKPGGIVSIMFWSSQRLLPGYPWLEAKLDETSVGLAPCTKQGNPDRHPLRATNWFRKAGLVNTSIRTLVGDIRAPLNDDFRTAYESLFDMRWQGAEVELEPEERAEYERLCLPDSPDFILNEPDYYAFFTYTLVFGQVPC